MTSLSGRGVGMDVVKRTIDALRGSIDMTSTEGHGTVMTLRLPLTLAIIDGLLVRVGRGRYVIPLSAVEECVELSVEDDAPLAAAAASLNIRGDLVPFLRLRELFSVSMPIEPYQKVVIVSAGELRVGLVLDQVIGDHQTVIKSLSKLHADVEIFSGATILGDGSVALILDIAHLVEHGAAARRTPDGRELGTANDDIMDRRPTAGGADLRYRGRDVRGGGRAYPRNPRSGADHRGAAKPGVRPAG